MGINNVKYCVVDIICYFLSDFPHPGRRLFIRTEMTDSDSIDSLVGTLANE